MSGEMMRYQPQNYDGLVDLAKMVVRSSICAVRSPEDALMILLTGAELGLSAMQSLRGIHVVKGRPVLAADTMGAVVRKSGICEMLHLVESTDQRCTYKTKRKDDTREESVTWTMDDAKRAQLSGDNWKKYPKAMLRARALSAICRAVYPDVVAGLYDPDELAAQADEPTNNVTVTYPDAVDVTPVEEARRAPNPGPTSASAKTISDGEEHDALVEELRGYLKKAALGGPLNKLILEGFLIRYGEGEAEMGRVPLKALRVALKQLRLDIERHGLETALKDMTEWADDVVDGGAA